MVSIASLVDARIDYVLVVDGVAQWCPGRVLRLSPKPRDAAAGWAIVAFDEKDMPESENITVKCEDSRRDVIWREEQPPVRDTLFKVGDSVEVQSVEVGYIGSWFPCVVQRIVEMAPESPVQGEPQEATRTMKTVTTLGKVGFKLNKHLRKMAEAAEAAKEAAATDRSKSIASSGGGGPIAIERVMYEVRHGCLCLRCALERWPIRCIALCRSQPSGLADRSLLPLRR
jgi:hypothetical protein